MAEWGKLQIFSLKSNYEHGQLKRQQNPTQKPTKVYNNLRCIYTQNTATHWLRSVGLHGVLSPGGPSVPFTPPRAQGTHTEGLPRWGFAK